MILASFLSGVAPEVATSTDEREAPLWGAPVGELAIALASFRLSTMVDFLHQRAFIPLLPSRTDTPERRCKEFYRFDSFARPDLWECLDPADKCLQMRRAGLESRSSGHEKLPLFLANSIHDVFYDGFHLVSGEGKRIAVRNNADGLASAVHDHLAGLAFAQVLLQPGPHFGAGGKLHVVAKLCQEFCATKHRGSCFRCARNGARGSLAASI